MADRALGCDGVQRRVQVLKGSGENDERERPLLRVRAARFRASASKR